MAAPGRPRLSGGHAGGRPLPLAIPASARPTSSRVREAMFSLVGHDLSGDRVLDAFGGSGLLGLEAWSRGASVVIVEQNTRALATIRGNVEGLGATIEVLRGDVLKLASSLGAFSGVLVDPPYALDATPIVAALAPCVQRWLLLEGHRSSPVPEAPPGLVMARERCYGDTVLRVFEREGG